MKFKSFSVILVAMFATSAFAQTGIKTKALSDDAWDAAQWISAADAQVVTGKASDIKRSADGSAWFVCKVKNNGKVVSAKWMATGLGVFDLYINGQLVGDEVLKPGFTHYAKTKMQNPKIFQSAKVS